MAQLILWVAVSGLIKITAKIRNSRKKSKLELENESLDFVLLNLSGHFLEKNAFDEVLSWGKCKIIERKIANVDLTNPISYMQNIVDFCANTLQELIKNNGILNLLLVGKYIFIPPGMPSIAITFTTMLHGITGRFPKMSFSFKKGDLYNLVKSYNFQTLRNKCRDIQKPQKEIKNVEEELVLLKLSKHPLSPEAISEVKRWGKYKIIERNVPNVNLKDPLAYIDEVINFCSDTINDIIENEGVLNHLELGRYVIIPSGMTSVAITFTTMFHGITGRFPFMAFFYAKDMIFDLTKPFNFYELRTQFRDFSN